jgi:transcriptional regulator with XRE-family HTH domain
MKLQKKVGQQIKKIRREKEMSQQKLSELSEVERKYISNIELGKVNLTLSTLERLADSLDKKVKIELE